MSKKDSKLIFLILLVALSLRIIGINHSFPFIFHPDEPTIIRSALAIRFNPNPKHFDWPHLYIYFNYFLYMGFSFVRDFVCSHGWKPFLSEKIPIIWDDNLVFYLITRIATALFGAFTVIPIYLTGKKLFNPKIGIIAALIFAIIPLHVRNSHYSLPDIPMVFLLAWSLYFASNILQENNIASYSGAGLLAGLSASTKYNGAFSSLAIPLAHILRLATKRIRRDKAEEDIISVYSISCLLSSVLFAVLGFMIGTPYALLDYKTFLRTDGPSGALWQFTNVGAEQISFLIRIERFFNQMVYTLSDDFGYTILILYFLGLFFLIYRIVRKYFTKYDVSLVFLYVPSLLMLFYVSGFAKSRSHYYLIVYPYIAILAAFFFDELFSYIQRKFKYLAFIVLLLLIPPFFLAFKNTAEFYWGDTRKEFYDWSQESLTKSFPIITVSSDIDMPLSRLGNRVVDVNYEKIPHGTGYFIYTDTDATAAVKVFKKLRKYSYVRFFDNYFRNGPNVRVYSYEL